MMGRIVVLLMLLECGEMSTASHRLQCFIAVTPGLNFTIFELDGEKIFNCDSKKLIPELECIKSDADEPEFRKRVKSKIWAEYDDLQHRVDETVEASNHTEGHTYQWIYGCELYDNGTTEGHDEYGYDGEDFISLDLKTGTWKTNRTNITGKWDPDSLYALDRKIYLTEQNRPQEKCIDLLKTFLSCASETVKSKVPPTASVFQKHSSPEVVCHATGFFPKTVKITWQKDGEDVHEDVDLRETLPNQDGSFQKRSVLTVSAEDLQKHTYTCVIQHSSLEKEIVLPVSERRILNPGGGWIGVVVVLVVVIAVGGGGIVCWKKTYSVFTRVPDSDSERPSEVTSDLLVCGVTTASLPTQIRSESVIKIFNVYNKLATKLTK